MALGVTACSEAIYQAFVSDDKMKTFYHGHSFTANPLACASALASLDLLEKTGCTDNIESICGLQQQFIESLINKPLKRQTKHHRRCGTIAAFEIETDYEDNYLNELSSVFTRYCLGNGVYLRPLGNTIYVMPPYSITPGQLEKIYSVIRDFLDI